MEATTQVSVINSSIEVLRTAPEILQANQVRKDKALAVGTNILAAIAEQGMNPQLDERAQGYLANINAANKQMKDSRSAVTQIMDQLRKMYTEVENEIDPKKSGTVPFLIQAERDNYARKLAEEAEAKRKAAEAELERKRQLIDYKTEMEKALNKWCLDYVANECERLSGLFNTVSLENYDKAEAYYKSFAPVDFAKLVDEFDFRTPLFDLVSQEDRISIERDVKLMKRQEQAPYEKLIAHQAGLIEKLPNKKLELEELKRLEQEGKEAELLKLQQEQREREAADKAKLEREAAEAKAAAEREAEIKKQGEQTLAMFDKEAELAELAPTPETRTGFEIEVTHPVGFTQIFALWFELAGKDLPMEKIRNTKIDQMITWAEKHAHKSDAKIDSQFIKYHNTYKAVNRKN